MGLGGLEDTGPHGQLRDFWAKSGSKPKLLRLCAQWVF